MIYNIDLDNDFIAVTTRTPTAKAKISHGCHIKLKSFCAARDPINSVNH